MKYLILLYLVLNPLFFLIGVELRPAQEMFYQVSSMALILAGLFYPKKPVKISAINVTLGIWVLWMLMLWLREGMLGWSVLLNTFLGVLVYLTVIQNLEKDEFRFIFKGLAWFSLFIGIHLG